MAARLSVARIVRDQAGTTAIEYAMIGALVFLAIITSVTAFGNKTSSIMQNVSTSISTAIGG